MNYGSDLLLNTEGDMDITADGGLHTVSGARLIAQDIREELATPLGSLPWAPNAGSSVANARNAADIADDDIIHELERLALKDPRVDAASVRANRIAEGRFRLLFAPLGSLDAERLDFDIPGKATE